MEGIFIEIDKSYFSEDKNIIVGVVYRPHGNCTGFIEAMSDIIQNVKSENKKCYLTGDYNLDLFKLDLHKPTAEFF